MATTPPSTSQAGALLCVCNYPSNTGYAWDFIESLYARIAAQLAPLGVTTYVAYPRIDEPPASLRDSPAVAVTLDASLGTAASTRATLAFAKAHDVRAIYLTDRPARSRFYARIHALGGVAIVTHDHTSGARSRPAGLRRALKWALARVPLTRADVIVAVSDYVRRRQIEVGMMPEKAVVRVWNGTRVPPPPAPGARPLHQALGIRETRPAVVCACRAAPEKGVPVLLRAFDTVRRAWPADREPPVLVYMGDGPQFQEIRSLREALASAADIVLTGYRADAGALVAGADVCAMPSIWQDALPLAVMQPMALGLPVVASNVGGIPEMIADGDSGVLVPPGDVPALAAALERLLLDGALRSRLGASARATVESRFSPDEQIDALSSIIRRLVPAWSQSR